MWSVVARRYVLPAVVFPVALVVGAAGYYLETLVSDKATPSSTTSVAEQRERRLMRESESADPAVVSSLANPVPGSVLSKNLSPSLTQTAD